jgi:hypothetical protein
MGRFATGDRTPVSERILTLGFYWRFIREFALVFNT